jgi:hypothetical protein
MVANLGKLPRPRSATPIVAIAAVMLALVFAMPKPAHVSNCIDRIALGLGLTYARNCDSNHITRDARNLVRYLDEVSPSRSRPVHIVAVAALAHVLYPLLVPLAALIKPLGVGAGELLPFYLAAIIFNAGVLAISFWIIQRLIGDVEDAIFPAALMGVLATYDVTLAWFWIPHQILMNVLAPLGAVFTFVTGMRARQLSPYALAILGLVAAAGALTYGYCLVWPLAFGIGAVWGYLLSPRRGIFELAAALLPFGLAYLAPFAVWFGPFALLGRDVAYEAQKVGQFGWLREAAASSDVVPALLLRLRVFAVAVLGYVGLWGTIMIALAVAAGVTVRRLRPQLRVATDPVVLGALVTVALMLVFNFSQGYHQARLLMFPVLLAQIVLLRLLAVSGIGGVGLAAALIALVQLAGNLIGPPASLQ